MSKKNEEVNAPVADAAVADREPGSDDNWTSDDVPCLAIGEGEDKKGKARIQKFQGVYLYSIIRRIKRRETVLHRFSSATADGERIQGECLVYGSGAVNHKLALIPEHTKIRLTYLGEVDTGQDSPMKNILVEWPKGTKLVQKAKPRVDVDNSDDDGDVPF